MCTDRIGWEGLPSGLREAVAEQIGPPAKVETIDEGRRTPLVATFTIGQGTGCSSKPPRTGTRVGEQLAREQAVAPHVAAVARGLLHAVRADGWRLPASNGSTGLGRTTWSTRPTSRSSCRYSPPRPARLPCGQPADPV
ncbi:hypothetical protein [Actinomadura sp. CNU-125]|uniref:hypothetical protein n=1 Tax=Actinomadura sp. CNU-125 TaxID=1904961 RepID=UPI00117818DB|nr:hypothetical protein [Actinomadura sp. CNU-125]